MVNIDFKSAIELLQAFPDEQCCIEHLEELRWEGFVTSPFDPTSKIYVCLDNRYRCKNSGKYFNVKTGTIFHNSKVALQKWFLAIWIITSTRNKITSVKLSKELNITQKTAWYMIQRISSYYKTEKENIPQESKWPLQKNSASFNKPIEKIEVEVDKNRLQLLEWLQILKK